MLILLQGLTNTNCIIVLLNMIFVINFSLTVVSLLNVALLWLSAAGNAMENWDILPVGKTVFSDRFVILGGIQTLK